MFVEYDTNISFTAGGAKKFLYSGPKKNTEEEDDLPWNFGSKPQKTSTTGTNIDACVTELS